MIICVLIFLSSCTGSEEFDSFEDRLLEEILSEPQPGTDTTGSSLEEAFESVDYMAVNSGNEPTDFTVFIRQLNVLRQSLTSAGVTTVLDVPAQRIVLRLESSDDHEMTIVELLIAKSTVTVSVTSTLNGNPGVELRDWTNTVTVDIEGLTLSSVRLKSPSSDVSLHMLKPIDLHMSCRPDGMSCRDTVDIRTGAIALQGTLGGDSAVMIIKLGTWPDGTLTSDDIETSVTVSNVGCSVNVNNGFLTGRYKNSKIKATGFRSKFSFKSLRFATGYPIAFDDLHILKVRRADAAMDDVREKALTMWRTGRTVREDRRQERAPVPEDVGAESEASRTFIQKILGAALQPKLTKFVQKVVIPSKLKKLIRSLCWIPQRNSIKPNATPVSRVYFPTTTCTCEGGVTCGVVLHSKMRADHPATAFEDLVEAAGGAAQQSTPSRWPNFGPLEFSTRLFIGGARDGGSRASARAPAPRAVCVTNTPGKMYVEQWPLSDVDVTITATLNDRWTVTSGRIEPRGHALALRDVFQRPRQTAGVCGQRGENGGGVWEFQRLSPLTIGNRGGRRTFSMNLPTTIRRVKDTGGGVSIDVSQLTLDGEFRVGKSVWMRGSLSPAEVGREVRFDLSRGTAAEKKFTFQWPDGNIADVSVDLRRHRQAVKFNIPRHLELASPEITIEWKNVGRNAPAIGVVKTRDGGSQTQMGFGLCAPSRDPRADLADAISSMSPMSSDTYFTVKANARGSDITIRVTDKTGFFGVAVMDSSEDTMSRLHAAMRSQPVVEIAIDTSVRVRLVVEIDQLQLDVAGPGEATLTIEFNTKVRSPPGFDPPRLPRAIHLSGGDVEGCATDEAHQFDVMADNPLTAFAVSIVDAVGGFFDPTARRVADRFASVKYVRKVCQMMMRLSCGV